MLILVRGLPGSGKSSLAREFNTYVCSADDYFMEDGDYKFDASKLADAHADCLKRTRDILTDVRDLGDCVVANTFSQRWEMEPYIRLARELDIRLYIVDLYDGGLTSEELAARNSHGVPLSSIENMRARWEHDWKNGNPIPPWERE